MILFFVMLLLLVALEIGLFFIDGAPDMAFPRLKILVMVITISLVLLLSLRM